MRKKGLTGLSMLFILVATAALMLGGCSDGKNGANGTNGTNANGTVSATTLTVDEMSKLSLSSTNSSVTAVAINSPPVVTFTVRDANNRAITGLGYTTKNTVAGRSPATNLVGLSNISFTIAKLVPGTNGTPNKWVNYIVWALPYTSTTGTAVVAAPSKPTTDNNGTLVDNGDGSYTYTFARDIKLAQSVLGAATYTGNNVKADLDDVTYVPTLPHRLVVQIGGDVRGTGTNNTDGTNTATGLTSVVFANPINLIYDFIPATGAVIKSADAQREITDIAKCNSCHGKLGFHGGSARVEAKYCVICHTDQRKYGNAEAGTTTTGYNGTSKVYGAAADVNTYKINNQAQGDFVTMIHRLHMSSKLAKTGYNYAGIVFDKGGYPQDPGLCRKCHDSNAPTTTPQGDNWRVKPSRLACGTCHDGIKWSDGTGSTVANAAAYKAQKTALGIAPTAMAATGHVGGAALNDSACVTCHSAALIESNHRQPNKTANNPTLPAGLKEITYDVKSAAVDSITNVTTIVFRISADGTPITIPLIAGLPTGFTGGPSFLLAYSLPQEGSTIAPPDHNNLGRNAAQPITVSLANISDKTKGELANPDASGYYTATIPTGVNNFPVGAKYRTVALQGYYSQLDSVITIATPRHAISKYVTVTGDTARRKVVDPAKCGSCHEWFEGHGGNRVYETQVCVTCHVPNLSSSGKMLDPKYITSTDAAYIKLTPVQTALLTTWTTSTLSTYILGFDAATNSSYPEAPQNFKDMIHGIHAGANAFNSESTRTKGLQFVRGDSAATRSSIVYFDASAFKYPNKLNNCDSCHIPGTYATSKIPAGALQSNNWTTTDATMPTPAALTSANVVIARGAASLPNNTDRVTSPATAACITCHDSTLAQAHMTTNGGKINGLRNTAYLEQCNLCHGDGSDFDPAKVHNK